MRRIAVEEHFFTDRFQKFLRSRKGIPRLDPLPGSVFERLWLAPSYFIPSGGGLSAALLDVGEGRLKAMDENEIDIQVLSLSFPGVELLRPDEGTALAIETNDELAETINGSHGRLAGFASIAPQKPVAAAQELERAVTKLGLKGALINCHVLGGEYLDEPKYEVIMEAAESLKAPVYIHPRQPSPNMIKPYLTYKHLAGAMWGFSAEAGLQAMRLIMSGVLERYPGLQIILGHLGEGLPFWLWRLDSRWIESEPNGPSGPLNRKPSEYFKQNFYVTTSGMFWQPALLMTLDALGPDRIMFAVDYPYEAPGEAVHIIDGLPINNIAREKIYYLNAEKLLKL